MLAKYVTAGIAGSLLLASAAFAAEDNATKTTTAPAPATQSSASTTSFHGDWRASKVVGLNVYNEKNENVGSINDLLMDKSGSIKAAVRPRRNRRRPIPGIRITPRSTAPRKS